MKCLRKVKTTNAQFQNGTFSVFSHSRWTVARFIFIIIYKYHLFALFFLFIYRFFKPYLRFWHLSQLVNMYCPTWEVHIYHTTFHRWRSVHSKLFHRNGFRQVAGLVHVAALGDGDVVGKQLERDDGEDGL